MHKLKNFAVDAGSLALMLVVVLPVFFIGMRIVVNVIARWNPDIAGKVGGAYRL